MAASVKSGMELILRGYVGKLTALILDNLENFYNDSFLLL